MFRDLFRKPGYAALMTALTAFLLALDTWFDFREGDRESSLATTHTRDAAFFIQHFGTSYFHVGTALNIVIALLSGLLITIAVANYRQQRATGAICSTAGVVALGFLTFGCPGCIMPLAGTLGITFFTKALPFFGLEFKLLSLVVLLATLAWHVRRFPTTAMVTPRPMATMGPSVSA